MPTRTMLLAVLALATACAPPMPPPAVPPGAVGPDAGVPAPDPQPRPSPERTCTLIGCEDGWSVELVGGTLPETYTVVVRVDGQTVASVECSPTNPCARTMFLPGVTAAEAELEIVGAEVPLRWTVTPEYNLVQPNGPDCPPTCRQARVQVQLS